jgi:protein phosphatase
MFTRSKKSAAPEAIRPTDAGTRAAYPPAFTITAAFLSDRGRRREVNEDAWRYELPDDARRAQKGVLALVADGMGGHAAGDIASKLAVTLIARTYYNQPQPPQAALATALEAANRAIYQAAQHQPQLHGMGTTCTALVLHEGAAYSAQVGDSRLYLVRNEQIYLMSEDHSAVMEMVRRGQMTIADARQHEDKNIILRALGTQPEVNVATWQTPFPVRDGDQFILCSDGLYDLVSDEEIRQSVAINEPPAACERLIALACERGGYDNITAGIIKCCANRRTQHFS